MSTVLTVVIALLVVGVFGGIAVQIKAPSGYLGPGITGGCLLAVACLLVLGLIATFFAGMLFSN